MAQNKQNYWHFHIRFHRLSTYAGKRKKEGGGLAKSVIYCLVATFFLKVHTRKTQNQKDLAYLSVCTL